MDNKHVPCIPEDILVEILERLSVLSVIRCKSVSMAWNRLISDKSFPIERVSNLAMTHLLICRQCDNNKLIYWEPGPHKKSDMPIDLYTICVDHDTINKSDNNHPSPTTTTNTHPIPVLGGQLGNMLTIMNSCNGLILCRIQSKVFLVANPSNQTWSPLPKPPSSCLRPLHDKPYNMALVFDPKISNHFQVVCPILSEDRLTVILFSSESGVWTTSHQVPLPQYDVGFNPICCILLVCPSGFNPSVHIDGALIYMTTAVYGVIRFNVDEETVELIQLPSDRMLTYHWCHFGIQKGDLHYCEFRRYNNTRMKVWKLDQDSSTNRGTLKCTISFQLLFAHLNLLSQPFYQHTKICFHPDKDIIFMRISKSYIISYEFGAARTKVMLLEDSEWREGLFPLSACLVNLHEVMRECYI